MSEEVSVETRLKEAVKTVAKGLEARGVLREPALEIAKKHSERIFISANGSVRVASRSGSFYPVTEDPFESLVGELYRSVPVTDRAAGTPADLESARQRLRQTGQY